MFTKYAAVLGAAAGVAQAAAIGPVAARDSCGSLTLVDNHIEKLSLSIIEYPVVINNYYTENTIIIVENGPTIHVTNAPTTVSTTVSATSTVTSTTTLTIAASAATSIVASGASSSSVGATNNVATSTATGSISIVTNSAYGFTSTQNPVAGPSAVGAGLNTSLFTATSFYTTATPTTTLYPYANGTTSALPTGTLAAGSFTNWTSFKANGANIGGWLEKEYVMDSTWWDSFETDATDEWTLCEALGDNCGPALEERYASYITTDDIDKLASVGVNTLRIPTTYAAWVDLPGSALYHGNQKAFLKTITDYAISNYGMRIIVGLHSLPGGMNSLNIGEAYGHDGWFNNQTNLDYSWQAIDAILEFFQDGDYVNYFTIAPINEASDNFAAFATAEGLTANGTAWIVNYIDGVFDRIAAIDKRIPLMLQDCFLGEEFWSPYFAVGTNMVIDTHIYYFAASGIYSEYVYPAICGQAAVAGGDGKFPVFVGEWALQVLYNNSLAAREEIFNTQRYAWSKYVQGGTFWTAVFHGTDAVDGEGTQQDYWGYLSLIDAGVIKSPLSNVTYC